VHKGTHQHKTNNQKEEKSKEMTLTNKKRDKEDFRVCFGGKREQLWSRTCLLLFFFLFFLPLSMHFKTKSIGSIAFFVFCFWQSINNHQTNAFICVGLFVLFV
jgi:hypothetical protein